MWNAEFWATRFFCTQVWTPENYEGEYDGPITYRRALAHSRNVATIKVAERAGYDKIAELWKRLGVGNPPKPYPSIALGVFEATPREIATAYTIFPNGGVIRQLKPILRILKGGKDVTQRDTAKPRRVAHAETAYLVTNMMRSVLNEGTAASARTTSRRCGSPRGAAMAATTASGASAPARPRLRSLSPPSR